MLKCFTRVISDGSSPTRSLRRGSVSIIRGHMRDGKLHLCGQRLHPACPMTEREIQGFAFMMGTGYSCNRCFGFLFMQGETGIED